jgi:gas vesicle protein
MSAGFLARAGKVNHIFLPDTPRVQGSLLTKKFPRRSLGTYRKKEAIMKRALLVLLTVALTVIPGTLPAQTGGEDQSQPPQPAPGKIPDFKIPDFKIPPEKMKEMQQGMKQAQELINQFKIDPAAMKQMMEMIQKMPELVNQFKITPEMMKQMQDIGKQMQGTVDQFKKDSEFMKNMEGMAKEMQKIAPSPPAPEEPGRQP